ncbi:hypothetical protein A2U01_0024531, partial [Trifolium medium]|nr:hypothetical protein [Trifolium medium]
MSSKTSHFARGKLRTFFQTVSNNNPRLVTVALCIPVRLRMVVMYWYSDDPSSSAPVAAREPLVVPRVASVYFWREQLNNCDMFLASWTSSFTCALVVDDDGRRMNDSSCLFLIDDDCGGLLLIRGLKFP